MRLQRNVVPKILAMSFACSQLRALRMLGGNLSSIGMYFSYFTCPMCAWDSMFIPLQNRKSKIGRLEKKKVHLEGWTLLEVTLSLSTWLKPFWLLLHEEDLGLQWFHARLNKSLPKMSIKIPRNCESGTLYGKSDCADMTKARVLTGWNYPEWFTWILYNHRVSVRGGQEDQSQREEIWGWKQKSEKRGHCTATSYMAEGTTSQGMWTISRSRQESQGKTKQHNTTKTQVLPRELPRVL